MKKIILLMLIALPLAQTVRGQVKAHYAEQYNKSTDVLQAKRWVSSKGHFRADNYRENGVMTAIYRADSAKIYLLFVDKKMYMVMPKSQLNKNDFIGLDIEVAQNTQTKDIGMEEIEGKMCQHIQYTFTSTLKDGFTETHTQDEWIWEPINASIQSNPGMGIDGRPTISRNIQIGEQPDHLFEIPKDYTAMAFPAGGLTEIYESVMGKSVSDIKGELDNSDAKKSLEQLMELGNDKNKTQEQKTQEMLKMFEGLNKKK